MAGVATAVVYDAVVNYRFDRETALIPGGATQFSVPADQTPMTVSADVDPVLG